MKKEYIFRNSKNWYTRSTNYASQHLIAFAVNNADKLILDVGCATGEYCQRLTKVGFRCVGVDINSEYVAKAREKDVEAYVMDVKCLKFPDKSFDTVLLFEVLEHVDSPSEILNEAKRVARKNILITTPNCTEFSTLKKHGLTYEHMLEEDHVNFFTKKDLEELLSNHFKKFRVEEREPINIIFSPWWLRKLISLLYKLKILKSVVYYRLFAVAEIDQ